MRCNQCGAPINCRKVDGKWRCFNLDSTPHYHEQPKVKWSTNGKTVSKRYARPVKPAAELRPWQSRHMKVIRGT